MSIHSNLISPRFIEDHAKSHVFDESSLKNAIENNEITLYYQPQIDLPTGQVVGFEALLRWEHPHYGVTLPAAFIPLAEQTGQIKQLTNFAIDTGFKFIEKLGSELSISLYISDQHIKDNQLVDTLDDSCQAFNMAPGRVILEFSEKVTSENTSDTDNILTQLKLSGFRLGIDDLGAGYSGLTQSQQLQFSDLKIDKTLVKTMEISSESRQSIVSTIELAKNLGISTIAEGIENNLEAIGLRELGCQFGQGYYFANPMTDADTLDWLEQWNKNLDSSGFTN
jgi:EAL domain-containing protein (putative c-di-GMP-specific phosphodiesterase class I)